MMYDLRFRLGMLSWAGLGWLGLAVGSLSAAHADPALVAIATPADTDAALEDLPLSRPADMQLVGHCRRVYYGHGGYAPVPYQAFYGGYGYPSYYQYRAIVVPYVNYRAYYGGYGGYGYYGGHHGHGGHCGDRHHFGW